jgi:hypothetical protein
MNEPEWCTEGAPDGGGRHPKKTIPFARMRDFLTAALARVRSGNSRLRRTIGFAKHASIRGWDAAGLGVDYAQYHYYGRPSAVPSASGAWEMMCGEFASRPSGRDNHLWDDLGSDQSVLHRLCHLQERGHAMGLVWSRYARDEATTWSTQVEQDIDDFTHDRCARLATSSG